jgi:hypothetical protein
MPIANYTTDVAVEKTMGEVVGALQRRGVTRISTMYEDDGSPKGIAFTLKLPYGLFDFELPVRTEGVLRALKRDKVQPRYQTPEHAAKVAWRIAAEWLRAQSALIDAELVTMEEVMLPYMIANGRGQTTYDLFLANQKEISA